MKVLRFEMDLDFKQFLGLFKQTDNCQQVVLLEY